MNVLSMIFKKNIIFYNFNHFNFYFNFLFFKNFNLLFFFYFKPIFFYKKSDTLKKVFYNNINKKIILNFLNYFIFYNLHKGFFGKILNLNKFRTNQYNFYYNSFKKITNVIYNLYILKKNFLLFDNHYSDIYSLYYNMYTYKSMMQYSHYFFINSYYFTHKNWLYFYKQFCIDNNVLLIFIFNYNEYVNYMSDFKAINILTSALVLERYDGFWVDYPFYCSSYKLSKFLILVLFKNLFFIYVNYNSYNNKLLFLNLLSKCYI